jgi:hypothetical protein
MVRACVCVCVCGLMRGGVRMLLLCVRSAQQVERDVQSPKKSREH